MLYRNRSTFCAEGDFIALPSTLPRSRVFEFSHISYEVLSRCVCFAQAINLLANRVREVNIFIASSYRKKSYERTRKLDDDVPVFGDDV